MKTQSTYWQTNTNLSLQALLDNATCPPLLREVLGSAFPWQARNERTVAALLRAPRSAPLWTAALLALEAEAVLEDGTAVPLASLEPRQGQFAAALRVPLRAGQRWGLSRVARTPADEPIVAAVAVVELSGDLVQAARLALVGAWPEPARLAQAAAQLAGNPLNAQTIAAVAAAVEAEVDPPEDWLGSAQYRRAMAAVLTRRALETCREESSR